MLQCNLFHPLTSKMSAKTSFSVLKAQNKALMSLVVLKLTDKNDTTFLPR